jgi:antitoxin component YwqK of YwqJK toxin-antitoxin module
MVENLPYSNIQYALCNWVWRAVQSEKNYINGKLEGESKFHYKTGELKSKKEYKDGELDGYSTWYFKSGAIKDSKYFRNGKRPERKLRSMPAGAR